jgi:hypothetical protein
MTSGYVPQVDPDDGLLWPGRVRHLTDETHHAIRQPDFHQSAWQRNCIWQADSEPPALPVRQKEPPVPDTRILVGVHDIVIARFAPRIARLRLPVLAQLSARVHGLAELPDELLGRLRRETGIASLRPLLPARLGRPPPAESTDALVASLHSRAASFRLVVKVAHSAVVRGVHAISIVR